MNQNLAERVSGLLASFGESSDVKSRYLKLPGGHLPACLLYIENIVDTMSIQEHIIEPLLQKSVPEKEEFSFPFLIQEVLQVRDIEIVQDTSKVIEKLVNGATVILFEGEADVLSADTSKWMERSLSNPKGQRTVQGPDVGFTESRSGNVALIRKYIKNPTLKVDTQTYGKITNTSVTLVYLENMVDTEILSSIKKKLNEMTYDSVIGSNYITEYLTKESKSLFPLVLNSDRPDVASAEILEGRVCIVVDGTPFVLIAPAVLIQFFQSPDDYYLNSEATKYVRPLRFIFFWLSLYIPALYVAFTTFHKGLLPVNLLVGFTAQQQSVPFPTVFETLLVLSLTDAIYEGSSRLPQNLVITISLFGAIVFGQASVEAQLVQPITLVIISISFIYSSIIPIASMNYSVRILKISLILIGALLGLYGIALFTLMLLVHLCYLRSFSVPYLAPISPFTRRDLQKDVFIRKPIPEINQSIPAFHKEEQMEDQPKKENDS
ncbi:spore germination protein [Rossellomorea aquimaris]|uniref:spore germination protein n=1 Tax=Rossellomorea aquimaris TaxID=189382 RepID=UPI001CD3D407|nr:spore germination protein [Rossellomorea aquimaris]MCA1060231.1 spore germination protein [Rossellomorea aquimaris]